MSRQHTYSLLMILLRRSTVILVGTVVFPIMLFRADRARFYSYLHRVWSKTSDKPVWLQQVEAAPCDFY